MSTMLNTQTKKKTNKQKKKTAPKNNQKMCFEYKNQSVSERNEE